MSLIYVCDNYRHLVCLPYNIENLHRMAQELKINKCWFHKNASYPHYDIPKKRIDEISDKCIIVTSKELLSLIKGVSTKY